MNIAVLTSGGDAPGMNAAVRAVVRTAVFHNMNVTGVYKGFDGLINNNTVSLNIYSVADIIQRGGTFLYTARSDEFRTGEGLKKAVSTLKAAGTDILIVIGGDGSYRGALSLAEAGINVIAIPATIDNDVASTDYSIGFDTAVNTAIDAISKIRDTSYSNDRVDVVEVMGRNSGSIALYAGIAGGAEIIVIPEVRIDINAVCAKLLKGKKRGRLHSIIVYAEGMGDIENFCRTIEENDDISVKTTRLGYIQRGGSPSAFDRILASRFGARAVELILEGKFNRALCYTGNEYRDVSIEEAVSMKIKFDTKAYETAMMLSI